MVQRERVRRYATKLGNCAKHTGELLFYGSALVLLACLCPWLLCMRSEPGVRPDPQSQTLPDPKPIPLRRIHLSKHNLRDIEGSPEEVSANEELKAKTRRNGLESRLIKLPPEIRLMIWSLVVGRQKRHMVVAPTKKIKMEVKNKRGKMKKKEVQLYGYRSMSCTNWTGSRDTRQPESSPDGASFDYEVNLMTHSTCCVYPYLNQEQHDGLSLAMTCRTAYRETIDLLYKQTIFEFGNPGTVNPFLQTIPQDRSRWIREIEVYWDTKQPRPNEQQPNPWSSFSETVKGRLRLQRLNLSVRVDIGDTLPSLSGEGAAWLDPLVKLSDCGRGIRALGLQIQIEAFEEYTRPWGERESRRFRRELSEKLMVGEARPRRLRGMSAGGTSDAESISTQTTVSMVDDSSVFSLDITEAPPPGTPIPMQVPGTAAPLDFVPLQLDLATQTEQLPPMNSAPPGLLALSLAVSGPLSSNPVLSPISVVPPTASSSHWGLLESAPSSAALSPPATDVATALTFPTVGERGDAEEDEIHPAPLMTTTLGNAETPLAAVRKSNELPRDEHAQRTEPTNADGPPEV